MFNKILLACCGKRMEYLGTVEVTVGESANGAYRGFSSTSSSIGNFGELSLIDGNVTVLSFYHFIGGTGDTQRSYLISNISSDNVTLENKATGKMMSSFTSSFSGGSYQHVFMSSDPFEGVTAGQKCLIAFYA